MIISPGTLSYHIAVSSLACNNCDRDIDIGDDCYVDSSAGAEADKAKIYCKVCVDED